MNIVKITLIQSGARTHTQVHSITPQSFRAIKRSASPPKKPIPPRLLFFISLIVFTSFLNFYNYFSTSTMVCQAFFAEFQ
jgi:hypothetical protein